MPSTRPTAGAAQPVTVVTRAPHQGRIAIPVYGYASAPTDGRPVLGGPAVPVVVLSASDLIANGGTYALSGNPVALPVLTAAATTHVLGQAPIAVYPINSWPTNPWTPETLNPFADWNGASLSAFNDGDDITSWVDGIGGVTWFSPILQWAVPPKKQTVTNSGKSFLIERFLAQPTVNTACMQKTNAAVNHNIGTGDWAMVFVISHGTQNDVLFTGNNDNDQPDLLITAGNDMEIFYAFSGGGRFGGVTVTANAWHWLVYQSHGGNYEFYLDGVAGNTPANSGSAFGGGNNVWVLNIGTYGGFSPSNDNDIARLIVHKQALVAADIANYATYMNSTYGI